MAIFKLKLELFAIVCSFFIISGNAETCKDIVSRLLKGQLQTITQCITDLKYTESIQRQEKMACILKCVLQKQGFLGADGFVDASAIQDFIAKTLPESDRERSIEVLMDCAPQADGVNPKEENCMSYSPMIKCSMTALNKICG